MYSINKDWGNLADVHFIDPPSEIPVSRNQLSSCVHNAIISNSKPYGYGVICIYKHFRYHPHATAILSPEFKNIGTWNSYPDPFLEEVFLFRLYALIEWNIWFVSKRIRCILCISPFYYPIIPSPIIRKNERITWIAIQPTNALNFWNVRTYQRFVYVYI